MSDDPLYREIILEHWQNPQNCGVLEGAGIDASGNNPLCGDQIRITAKTQNGKVIDIAFTGEGCAISKASASLFTEHLKGKPLTEIQSMSEQEALDLLGVTVTPSRTKCALLPYVTFQRSL